MNLTILDRIILPNILPAEGSFDTLILKKDVLEKVQITQKELEKYEIRAEEGRVIWNEAGAKYELEVELTELETKLVTEQLKKLDDDNKLDDNTVNLYKKFK